MRTSNDIEEGSYVSYCKLDGGMFSFVVFQAKGLLLCPQMISESFSSGFQLFLLEYFTDKMPESTVGICMNEKDTSGSFEKLVGKEFEL